MQLFFTINQQTVPGWPSVGYERGRLAYILWQVWQGGCRVHQVRRGDAQSTRLWLHHLCRGVEYRERESTSTTAKFQLCSNWPFISFQVLQVPTHTVREKAIDPKRAKSRPICKKIFVGGIDANLSEDDIRGYFEKYGKVEGIELPFDRTRGKRREFCFIIFDTEEGADAACRDPKQMVGSRECDVKKAQPQPLAQQMKRQNQESGGGGGGGGGGRGDDDGRDLYGGGGRGGGASSSRGRDAHSRPSQSQYGAAADPYGYPSGNGYGAGAGAGAGGGAGAGAYGGSGGYGQYPGYSAGYGGQAGYGDYTAQQQQYYNQYYGQQYGDYWAQYGYAGYAGGAEGEYPASGYSGSQAPQEAAPYGGGGGRDTSHSSSHGGSSHGHHSTGKMITSKSSSSNRAPSSAYHPYGGGGGSGGGRGSNSSH